MIDPEILETLQNSSVEERIAIIEAILQSLKSDIAKTSKFKASSQKFELLTFDLGEDITINREDLYAERMQ